MNRISLLQQLYQKLFGNRTVPDDPKLRKTWEDCQLNTRRSLLNTPTSHCRFIILDTETTGFHAYGGDEIVSIAMLEYRGLQPTGKEYYQLINPRREIPASSTRIHGITDSDVSNAPILEEVMPEIVSFMQESVLVGHHLQFDIRFLNRNLYEWIGCKLKHPTLDTMLLYQTLSGQYGHYELEQVAQRCRVEVQQRHNALGDARTTAAIFEVLSQRLVEPNTPVKTLINQQISSQ